MTLEIFNLIHAARFSPLLLLRLTQILPQKFTPLSVVFSHSQKFCVGYLYKAEMQQDFKKTLHPKRPYRLEQKKGTALLSTSLAWPVVAGCSQAETFSQLSSISFAQPCTTCNRTSKNPCIRKDPTSTDLSSGLLCTELHYKACPRLRELSLYLQ